jgi:hypothetical protein
MVVSSPDRLVESNAGILAKFGYRAFDGAEEDWNGMWQLLKGDFTTLRRPWVPEFADLSPPQSEAARIYMRRRLIADRLFEECRRVQADLHQGIDTDRVEAYSIAREAYEESVEDFGAAREQVDALLP